MKKIVNRGLTAALCLWLLSCNAYAAQTLIPVGRVVGLELSNKTVTVAAFDDALGHCAKEGGLKIGDEIVDIDGVVIDDAEDVRLALEHSDGQVLIRVLRAQKEHEICLTPEITANGPRLGVYLRQGVTGIGTVTWYDPDTSRFGTLGHGVNDPSGDLVKMTSGRVYEASVQSVKRGKCGEPGQLRGGIENTAPVGNIVKNTNQGVFGTVDCGWKGEEIEVASKDEIKTGPATIRSTVSGDAVQEYSVEILKIYPTGNHERNMLIRITDPTLLAATGGIVQGMSGSPIIQDGKLVGAVTHV